MAGNIIPLVAGNWKMNGRVAARGELVKIIAGARALNGKADLMVCPPATLIASFSGAAEDMGLSASAAGKLISRLELRLGVGLINRTTRRLALTAEGEIYLDRVHEILAAARRPRRPWHATRCVHSAEPGV